MGLFGEVMKVLRPLPEEEEQDYGAPKKTNTVRENEFESADKVVKIHTTTQLSVVVFRPERYDQCGEIADHLRNRCTVVLNLESIKEMPAKLLKSFLAGVVYALDGRMQQVSANTFILTPYNVDIIGSDFFVELESNGMFI